MRLAVCESAAEMYAGSDEWKFLTSQTKELQVDLLLLNELPFGPWIATTPKPERETLLTSQKAHEDGIAALGELGVPCVLATRPTFENDKSVNQGFVWETSGKLTPVHTKQFFPEEEGYYEASWFERGETHFRLTEVKGLKVGFLICTEVMFNEWARYYGKNGAQLIVVPRATQLVTHDRWKTALSMAALVSGCYVASSNRHGSDQFGKKFGGKGMVFDPCGNLIAETSGEDPAIPVELDLREVEKAKKSYPFYVRELSESIK